MLVILRVLATLLLVSLIAGLAVAQDLDQDGRDDRLPMPGGVAPDRPDADVAIIDSSSGSQWYFLERLEGMGFVPTFVPRDAGLDILSQYDLVLLPMHTASGNNLEFFQTMASVYIDYIAGGGHFYMGQPNPYQNGHAEITWVPYHLVVSNFGGDCPAVIADPSHCIAQGITGADLPSPFDTVVELDPAWTVVAEGGQVGHPSVIIADFGEGRVLVEFGHPAPNAGCPYTDLGFSSMVMCLLQGDPVRTESLSWTSVRASFR